MIRHKNCFAQYTCISNTLILGNYLFGSNMCALELSKLLMSWGWVEVYSDSNNILHVVISG